MVIKNGQHKLVGFVELGAADDHIKKIIGNEEPSLATHVLQFIFLSDAGFRFPIAQFPSGHCSPTDLYLQFWKGVQKMTETGFTIYWCILDGADCHRQFIKLHFKDDPATANFITRNPYTGGSMHNFKKIHNNVEKSNKAKKPRCLKFEGKSILWKQWKDAFNWNQSSFSLPLHERLTIAHFELDPASRMRNHLAEDVLDKKKLFMLQSHRDHIITSTDNQDQEDGIPLDSSLRLLEHTSEIVDLVNSECPITCSNINDNG
ncbi:uncharacterized protein [Montipora capricornis]